jgi:hemerythrin-like domain-containing protein
MPTGAPGEKGKDRRGDRWAIDPLPDGILDAPLDYFLAEHHRQRQAASQLLAIADGACDPGGVKRLLEFLEEDFARHIAEEESAFFPLLRSVCLAEDVVEALLSRLALEHGQDESVGDQVFDILRALGAGKKPTPVDASRLRYFAEHLKRHIALENAVLLPLARARFTPEKERALAAILRERRVRRPVLLQ